MTSFIITVALGLIISAIGIMNLTGNISSIHWYHRRRVTEENIRSFGRLVGLGTLIIGLAVTVFGILSLVAEMAALSILVIIGAVILISGAVSGLTLSFYAMIRYNKGIF